MLFRCVAEGEKESGKMEFVQFMDRSPSLHSPGDALGCVCLRWTTAEGGKNGAEVNSLRKENNRTALREWLQVTSFENSPSTVTAFRADIAVHPLSREPTRLCHRLS